MILILAVVNSQPLKLTQPDGAVQQDASRHSRHLTAYNINTHDEDDDVDYATRCVLMAVSAVGVTSVITLCTCCPQYNRRHYR